MPSTMTKFFRLRILAIAGVVLGLVALGGVVFASLPAVAINLVNDPGFESSGLGWQKTSETGRSIVTTQAHSGTHSQEIIVGTSGFSEVYQDVAVNVGSNYDASAWVRTTNVTWSDATVEIQWLDGVGLPGSEALNAASILRTDLIGEFYGINPWTEVSASGLVPPAGSVVARIRLYLVTRSVASGTAWFDDISLTEIPPVPPTPTPIPPTPTNTPVPPTATPVPPTATPATVDWAEVTGKPAGFADDVDDDALGGLSCNTDQLIRWNGSVWECFFSGPTFTSYIDPDGANGYGIDTSIAIGSDGFPIIALVHQHLRELQVLHCLDLKCQSGQVSVLDSGAVNGILEPSIVIGNDGLANILYSFHESHQNKVKMAHCNDVACNSASNTEIYVGPYGEYASIATGTDGLPLISYEAGRSLFVVHCDDLPCQTFTTQLLGIAANTSRYPAMTIGSDGLGIIAYTVLPNESRTAHCIDVLCSAATITLIPPIAVTGGTIGVGGKNDIAIGSDGFPVIATTSSNSRLFIIHCDDLICSSATSVDSGAVDSNDTGVPSIAIGTDGLVLVSYGYGNELRLAHCNDVSCNFVRKTIVDDNVQTGDGASIAIGVDGLPIISYLETWNGILKVAHCPDPVTCVPQ